MDFSCSYWLINSTNHEVKRSNRLVSHSVQFCFALNPNSLNPLLRGRQCRTCLPLRFKATYALSACWMASCTKHWQAYVVHAKLSQFMYMPIQPAIVGLVLGVYSVKLWLTDVIFKQWQIQHYPTYMCSLKKATNHYQGRYGGTTF